MQSGMLESWEKRKKNNKTLNENSIKKISVIIESKKMVLKRLEIYIYLQWSSQIHQGPVGSNDMAA